MERLSLHPPMVVLAAKILALIIAFVVAVRVSLYHARRDFKPAGRAHLEIFLAGFPCGYIVGLLVFPIPNLAELLGFSTLTALLVGLGLSYSLPRQYRYMREKYPNTKW